MLARRASRFFLRQLPVSSPRRFGRTTAMWLKIASLGDARRQPGGSKLFKVAALRVIGLLVAAVAVCEGQAQVRTDLERIDHRTPLGEEVLTVLHEWRADLLSRDPGRLARHSGPDYKRAVRQQLEDQQSDLYRALYVGQQSVERVIKPVPDSRIIAFIHRMNAEGTYVLGCFERRPDALAVPPPPYVDLMKGLNTRDVFCLDLVKNKGKWRVDYTFASDDDAK
jgi:hypothetical protein